MSYKGDTFIITSIIVTAGQADANLEESAEALRDAACAIFSTEAVAKDFIESVTDLVHYGRLCKDTSFKDALALIAPLVKEYKCY